MKRKMKQVEKKLDTKQVLEIVKRAVALGLKGAALTTFLLVNAFPAFAERQEGTVRNIGTVVIASGEVRLFIDVDTTGNRIPDTYLEFSAPTRDFVARDLQVFVERGMSIVFDDEGYRVLESGNKQVRGSNTISIDGVNMVVLFPNERDRFRHAAAEFDRQNSRPTSQLIPPSFRNPEHNAVLASRRRGGRGTV